MSPTRTSGVVSGLGWHEMRENCRTLEGMIADHVLSHGGQAALAFVGDQLGRRLAVIALLDRFK